MTFLTAKRMSLAATAALALGSVGAPAAAQMRAVLPTIDQVEPLGSLPIDGVWQIREIGERIVIENGHAYAEDGWVHMMLFEIQPEQVVLRNIRELADGAFIAEDLPLMSNVKLVWISDTTLRGQTGGIIPVTYHLDLAFGGNDDAPLPPSDSDDQGVRPW